MRSARGQAVVEFALIAPVFLLIVIGAVSFSNAWNHNLALSAATRAAARAASTCRFTANYPQAIKDAYDAVADPALPGHPDTDPGVDFNNQSNSCVEGVEVTVTGTYPVSISFFGITVTATHLSASSATTVE